MSGRNRDKNRIGVYRSAFLVKPAERERFTQQVRKVEDRADLERLRATLRGIVLLLSGSRMSERGKRGVSQRMVAQMLGLSEPAMSSLMGRHVAGQPGRERCEEALQRVRAELMARD